MATDSTDSRSIALRESELNWMDIAKKETQGVHFRIKIADMIEDNEHQSKQSRITNLEEILSNTITLNDLVNNCNQRVYVLRKLYMQLTVVF